MDHLQSDESPEFWRDKDQTERALIVGWHGAPEVKKSERQRFLGELQERVLAAITSDQVAQTQIDAAVAEAVTDPRATTIIVRMNLPFEEVVKYSRLAAAHDLRFTQRSDPGFSGEVGLVVVSDQAIS